MNVASTRRDMLKVLALGTGASILEPLISRIAAHAAGDAKAIQKRVVFIVQGNGINPAHLMPSGMSRPRNGRPQNEQIEITSLKDRDLHSALEPLTPFKDRLTLLQGLSGKIALSDHSGNHGALGAYPANKGPMGQTIDSALAAALPAIVPHVALGIANRPDVTMNYQISASAPGKVVPIVCQPELALKALFGSVAAGAGRNAFDQKTMLLDFMAEDVKNARAQLVGSEKQQFDQYMEAFAALRDRQGKIDQIREPLKKHYPQIEAQLKKPTEVNKFDAQFEVATASLLAGLTNVVTLVSGGGGQHYISYPDLGIPVDGHHYGHGGGVEGKNAEQCFVTVRQYHCQKIAKLAKTLQSVPEGNGTMLDNTLIVYLSDSGDGHHPTGYEWPVILLGNLGGQLKSQGQFIQMPLYGTKNHRTMANLYSTLLHAVGKPTDKFGINDPGLKDVKQTGIVPELLA